MHLSGERWKCSAFWRENNRLCTGHLHVPHGGEEELKTVSVSHLSGQACNHPGSNEDMLRKSKGHCLWLKMVVETMVPKKLEFPQESLSGSRKRLKPGTTPRRKKPARSSPLSGSQPVMGQ